MCRKSESVPLPDSEWRFSEVSPQEKGACLFWELLREIEVPDGEDPLSNILANCATMPSFHRFIHNENYTPLKLVAWLISKNVWPDRPWVDLSDADRKAVQSIELVPPIVDVSGGNLFFEQRDKSELNREVDLHFFPFKYEIEYRLMGRSKDLTNVLGLTRHALVINWRQYNKEEILRAFESWLDSVSPSQPVDLPRAGRMEPKAWLANLSGYRLFKAADSDPEKLDKWKEALNLERGQALGRRHSTTILKASQSFQECFRKLFPDAVRLKVFL